MSRTACAALMLLVLPASVLADAAAATAIVAGIATPRDQVVPFVERRNNEMLARPLEFTGVVKFTADGELIKTIEAPFQERVVITRSAVRVERDGREHRLALDRDEGVRSFFLALRALLEGDSQTLAEHFDVTTVHSDEQWRIDMVPRHAALGRYLERMSVTGSGAVIKVIRTEQSEQDWQEMQFVSTAAQ